MVHADLGEEAPVRFEDIFCSRKKENYGLQGLFDDLLPKERGFRGLLHLCFVVDLCKRSGHVIATRF